MYQRFINNIKRILKSDTNAPFTDLAATRDPVNHQPKRIPRDQHTVSRKYLSKSALKVLYELQKSGYQAYLVGGCVRDVLLEQEPKDFDVVTNARPEQVKALFRNCRLIGRRFVLAHVYFGREIIEVATFRASHDSAKSQNAAAMRDGQIIRDNVYGDIDEDAWRRDFTVNALYYDISDFSLLDYANGLDDLQAGVLRLIGDPLLRYQEDPVRMLRAARFAAKLGMTIEKQTAAPIPDMASLLENIPSARLYEEVLKLLMSGHAAASLQQLQQYQLFPQLFRLTHELMQDDEICRRMVSFSVANTDQRVAENKPVAPAFLLAALLWRPVQQCITHYREQGYTAQDSLLAASDEVLQEQVKQVAIPRRVTTLMREIWLLQPRLENKRRNRRQRISILSNPRFRAAYDFLLLRAEAGEELQETVEVWQEILVEHPVPSSAQRSDERPRSRPRRRRQPSKP